MAVVYVHPVSGLLEWRHDREDERRHPLPDNLTAARRRRFDRETNGALFRDIQQHAARYTVTAGELWKDGSVVTPAADGQEFADAQMIDSLNDDIAALANLMTQVQLQAIVRRGLRVLRFVLRQTRQG